MTLTVGGVTGGPPPDPGETPPGGAAGSPGGAAGSPGGTAPPPGEPATDAPGAAPQSEQLLGGLRHGFKRNLLLRSNTSDPSNLNHIQFDPTGLTGTTSHPIDQALRKFRRMGAYSAMAKGTGPSTSESLQHASDIRASVTPVASTAKASPLVAPVA